MVPPPDGPPVQSRHRGNRTTPQTDSCRLWRPHIAAVGQSVVVMAAPCSAGSHSVVSCVAQQVSKPLQVLQRLEWPSTPIGLGDLFLHKNRREAPAALVTHQLGWVRLLVGSQLEVVQTQVCRDQEEVLATGERWKAALVRRGG